MTFSPKSAPAVPHPKGQTARLLEALRFAAEKHRDHRRKGDIAAPYINHPIVVAEQLAAVGLDDDPDLLVAALLHDVIEDTDATAEELQQRFGRRVTKVVLEVSDDQSLPWWERKKATLDNIGEKSRAAQMLKLSDLIANVTDLIHAPPNWDPMRKQYYLRWAEDVVGAMKGIPPQLERRFRCAVKRARDAVEP